MNNGTVVATASDPQATYKSLVDISIKKATLRIDKMIIMAILAGMYIGFGCQLSVVISTNCGGSGPCKYAGGLGFATGLMLVVGCGAELFTGNVLILVGMLARRISFKQVLKDWTIVWLANFVGSILVQALIFGGGSNGHQTRNTDQGDTVCKICISKGGQHRHEMLAEGMLANMLVCLAVILAIASKSMTGKIFACFFPVGAFVASGFEHSIANMSFFAQCVMLNCGGLAHGEMWLNLVLSTIGNVMGAGFLAICYWWVYVRDTEAQHASPLLDEYHSPHHITMTTATFAATTNEPVELTPGAAMVNVQGQEEKEEKTASDGDANKRE